MAKEYMQLKDQPYWTYKLGDKVQKKSGSEWHGTVVGFYQSTLTEEGYAIESDTEVGSVQIYPAKALQYQPCPLGLCDGSGEVVTYDPPIEPHLPATPAGSEPCKCKK